MVEKTLTFVNKVTTKSPKGASEMMLGKNIEYSRKYPIATEYLFLDSNSKSKPYTEFGKFRFKW